nr:3-oxo-5a-steroid 4- dehydrogenase [Polyrhizophydium stewartii]
MFYRFPTLFYRVPEGLEAMPPRTVTQVVTMLFFMVHFLKRELETVHVHRFSNDTMPLRNLPKNCFHYWILGGLFTAYPIYAPGFEHGYFPGLNGPVALTLLSLIWIFAEVSNYKTHVILRDLRPPGTRVRNIPKGYGFDLVTCPNYFFEILGWVAISLITGSIAMWIFTVAGAVQMYLWAVKKHKRYIKEFGDKYPRKRKILIPFVL